MSRYEQERKKREVVVQGKPVGRRQANVEEATRELSAAFVDLGEQLLKAHAHFLRRINAAWRRR